MDLAKEVTTAETYRWTQGSWTLKDGLPEAKSEDDLPFHVVAYDFGAKRNILRMLVDRGCRLTVVPAQTSAEEVLKMNRTASSCQTARRPGSVRLRDYCYPEIPRNRHSAIWHLPRSSATGAGERCEDR